jgi:hypothetical protein
MKIPSLLSSTVALSLAALCACDSDENPAAPQEETPFDGGSRTGPDGGTTTTGENSEIVDDTKIDAGATQGPNGCATFDSAYSAIQTLVFERHGCTAKACHGDAKVGDLDLRAGASYANLVDTPSSNSPFNRVQPGMPGTSFLFHKLHAATEPGSVQVAGSPMPIGAEPLSADELEAVKLWILKGAPQTGTVGDPTKGLEVGKLLNACLPALAPIKIKPLEAPAPGEGVQIRLPPYTLKGATEVENCMPFAYDFSAQVPAEFKDEARNVIFTNGSQVRQDPQSHHMVIWDPKQELSEPQAEPDKWTCHGGSKDTAKCDPKLGSSDCADGVCAGPFMPGTFCSQDPIVLRSLFAATGGLPTSIANTQGPQQLTPPLDGVYAEIPLRGIVWFNTHAFNLTEQDTLLESRVNYLFAKSRKRETRLVNDTNQVYAADGIPPFTRKTICAKHVVPQYVQIATLASHTHRRGEHFVVKDQTGKQFYESFEYNDPTYLRFNPFLSTFDGASEASRTLEFCATYNNGLTKNDEPDLNLVTRASKLPDRAMCTPVACVAGKVTAACTTDRDCDSAPGANDGDCDACPIAGGPTTENEMFVLMPWYVYPEKK